MNRGRASFTFDDGELSTYTAAFPLLRDHELRANLAVVTDWVGGDHRYSWEQIEVMADHGWEVMSHSESHSFAELDELRMHGEVAGSRATLEARGYVPRVFVMPGGSWDDDERFATGSPFEHLVRRTYDAFVPDVAPHPMREPADPYAVGYLCCECYGDTALEAPLEEILATVDRCAAKGLWANLLWHDVKGAYLETLTTVATHVQRLVQEGRLVNVTISEALGLDA